MEGKICYKNRELSWLQFNERVLNEAGNKAVPLAERLTFASIYQTNLDEFFMVRVGTIMVQMHSHEEITENKTHLSPKEQIAAILKRTKALEHKKADIYNELMCELEGQGVRIINFDKLSKEEGLMLEKYFDEHISPFLSPMIIGKAQPFPFLSNKALYAAVMLTTKNGKNKIGIVPCTNSVIKRLIEIPTRPGTFMLSEEIILHFVSKLYAKYSIREKSIMRITRNADIDTIDVYDEDMDYRGIMEHLIKRRVRLSPVRLELTRDINDVEKTILAKYVGIKTEHIIKVDTPLDLSFMFTIQNYLRDKSELFYQKRTPRMPACLDVRQSVTSQVLKKDVLLSYPYESFRPFIKLLNEAAFDENVVSIKITLYRLATKSEVVNALAEAAENGKEVVVVVELRARFDEANNIDMSRKLEDAGCRVIYGLDNYKVHSKLCLITRSNNGDISYITQVGTGNYNEKTSTLYTDLSLITADYKMGKSAAAVFNALLLGDTVESSNPLLVAPHCLQNKIVELMDEQISLGCEGYIGIKINSLTDKVLIKKLIEASKAGVKIEMIVRGICCLIPHIKGETENINIVSVVGRYLEHSRIYRFGKGENDKIYIASADFMTRNTTRRVEVAAPVFDEDAKKKLRHIFDTVMADNEKGKLLNSEGEYEDRDKSGGVINAQEMFFEEVYAAEKKV